MHELGLKKIYVLVVNSWSVQDNTCIYNPPGFLPSYTTLYKTSYNSFDYQSNSLGSFIRNKISRDLYTTRA